MVCQPLNGIIQRIVFLPYIYFLLYIILSDVNGNKLIIYKKFKSISGIFIKVNYNDVYIWIFGCLE